MAILNEEQTLLRDSAKGFATERAPTTLLRKLREDGGWKTGYDAGLWKEMGEMGWAGVIIPEAFGGSEFGYLGIGLVLEELGRTLAASPLHSTALVGASALLLGGSDAQKTAWLPRIAAGEIVTALAVDEAAHHDPKKVALSAARSGDGWVLSGKKRFIPDGAAADLLFVAARTSGKPGETAGVSLFLVEKGAAGLSAKALHAVDNRGVADIAFDGVKVGASALLGAEGEGFALLDQILDRARIGLAAEMLGTASQAFDITLEYLKTRTQFGQLIGSFQSMQHRAAKMFTELELTRSAVEAALGALDAGSADVPALASLAKALANETLHLVSNEMVQMHGGIGMTDAHDAGLYMKRARVAEALYGSSSFHRDRYAALGGY
jgi:alkylation response protein AidB-like acyl-CoA dehydrogenase